MTKRANNAIELTILMPCLNEANTIGECITKAQGYLAQRGLRGEVLIADNGSTDNSEKLAVAKGARVVRVQDRGYGAALRGGIAAARGRFVIMGDADDSYDFRDLDDFMSKLRGGCDIVIGNRFRGGIATGAMPFLHRYLGNPALSLIARVFFGTGVGDLLCGLRGFNRDRLLELNLHTTGMEFASEMVVSASMNGYRIEEVPTTLRKDGRSRPPHLRTWRDGWRYLRFMLMLSPRWLFIYPGSFLIALGVLGMALLFNGPVRLTSMVRLDFHTFIVAASLVVIGFQILTFGFLARRFGESYGFLPVSRSLSAFLNLSLEHSLVAAGGMIAAGLLGLVWALSSWAALHFGPLESPIVLRILVLSLTAIAIGIQIIFTAFLASIMDIPIARERVLTHHRLKSNI